MSEKTKYVYRCPPKTASDSSVVQNQRGEDSPQMAQMRRKRDTADGKGMRRLLIKG